MFAPFDVEYVFVIGVDGAGGPWVEKAKTPHMDAFFEGGVVTYRGRTVMPSTSFPAWGAMFTGVGPATYDALIRSPEKPLKDDAPWPTWINRLSRRWDEPVGGVFSAWPPITTHLVESRVEVDRVCAPDSALVPMAAVYIHERSPQLFFIHLDDVDLAGHSHGYGSPAYLEAITTQDNRVGILLDAIDEAGLADKSLTIILSDHGGITGSDGRGSHGGGTPEEVTILWAARGPGIEVGRTIDGPVSITDTSAVILTAAGAPLPDDWDAVVPEGVFTPA